MNWRPMATPSLISVADMGRTMNLETSVPFREGTRSPNLALGRPQAQPAFEWPLLSQPNQPLNLRCLRYFPEMMIPSTAM